ncbi:MAG: sulfite exporter TauE/SafE family protein [Thermosynechococcaceae cyanobacterium MS004]|nr:sulfite exporter TauE/SafE family protein [Thermosynechococcaceae cyanobacterium MS004]
MQWIVGLLLAGGIGLSLGLMGGGGSVLALPVLVYVMGVAPKSAIAMTLMIVGTVSLLGLIPHWRAGNINLKTALVFGPATMVGTFSGSKIATLPWVTGTFQMILFAVVMLMAAAFMIYRSTQSIVPDEPLALYPKPLCKYCWLWLLSEGVLVGILTGLVGVGGGFAIVPALVLLADVPMKQAIGTSLLIIIANSIAGFLGYLGHVNLDWHLMISFIFAASVGTLPGAYLARFVSAQRLQKIFGYFLLAVASFVLVQNRDSFRITQSQEVPRSYASVQRLFQDRRFGAARSNHSARVAR